MDLYRYVSFPIFVDMIQSSSLTLVSPLKAWEDRYEGLVYRALKTKKGRETIHRIIRQYTNDENELEQVLDATLKYIRCQCWSKSHDSLVLWNAYSYDKQAIMIKTTSEELEKMNLNITEIEYIPDDFNLEAETKRVVDEKGITLHKFFCVKRRAFNYEEECRVFQKPTGDKDIKEFVKIPISDIKCFVKEILVHPSAEEWYVDIVKKFCEDKDIPFNGQSNWYKLNFE